MSHVGCPICDKNKAAPQGYKHIYVHLGVPAIKGEWLWAAETLVETRVRIANIPMFVMELTQGDVVDIRDNQEAHRWDFMKLVIPSGEIASRLMFAEEMDSNAMVDFERITKAMGGKSEWFNNLLVAVQAPEDLLPDIIRPYVEAGMARTDTPYVLT